MRIIVASALLALSLSAGVAAESPLAPYVDRARILVVSAPAEDDPQLRGQLDMARREAAGMRERDLVLISVVGQEAHDDKGATLTAALLRKALALPADRFEVVLIGKDGGEKLRSGTVLPPERLFSTIDTMPMRKDEVREENRGG